MKLLLAVGTLWWREQVRFFRQRSRVFGALVQPLLFWALFGAGLQASFHPPTGGTETSYLEYFYPGTIILILLFTAIFSTISVIEDRREGFLQSVLVAPIPRSALVIGKVLGGATLALAQGSLLLVLAPAAGIFPRFPSILDALVIQFIVALALTALSFCIAWRMDSTQGFHAVMTVFLMPLWLLSGAFFPADGVPGWLGLLMRLNPLTYGTAALRRALASGEMGLPPELPSFPLSMGVTILFAVSMLALATIVARGRTTGGRA